MQLTVQYIMKEEEEAKAFEEAITLAKRLEEVKAKCNNCIYYHPKFKLCYGCIGSLYLIGDAEKEYCDYFENKNKEWIE